MIHFLERCFIREALKVICLSSLVIHLLEDFSIREALRVIDLLEFPYASFVKQ
jgi:hypothetical protein